MWRATLKGILAHKLRLSLTALAIVLGVLFVSGTLVLTETLQATFDNLFTNVYRNGTFVVRGGAPSVPGGGWLRPPGPWGDIHSAWPPKARPSPPAAPRRSAPRSIRIRR